MPKQRKLPYNATIRFRAFKQLEERINRIVNARGYGDPADFMREGMSKLVIEEERRLGLPPMEPPARKPVKYSKSKPRRKR